MSCLTNLPKNLEPSIECATDIANFGPVAALLTILIGIPLVKLVLRYVKQFFEKYDYIDEGIENFLFKVVSVALWLVILLKY